MGRRGGPRRSVYTANSDCMHDAASRAELPPGLPCGTAVGGAAMRLSGAPEADLLGLHVCFFLGLQVIVADEVEQAVDEEEGDLLGEPPGQGLGLDAQLGGDAGAVGVGGDEALGVLDADDDVAQGEGGGVVLVRVEQGEGEDIGGGVLLAPLAVELVDGGVIAQDDADLRVARQVERLEVLLRAVAQGLAQGVDQRVLGCAPLGLDHDRQGQAPWWCQAA
jgi:hypothetical protein